MRNVLRRLSQHGRLLLGGIVTLCIAGAAPAATYYVATNGLDTNAGTQAAPWKTIAASVNKLAAGDTLFVRGGTYYESNIIVNCAGTSSSPITIRNFAGETPTIDGAFPEFQTIGNTAWTLFDAAKNIYRSVNTYNNSTENLAGFCGGKYEYNGVTYALMPYLTRTALDGVTPIPGYDYLSSDDDTYQKYQGRYFGPGVCYGGPSGDTNHIYIRLKGVSTQSTFGVSFPFPTDQNPANLKVSITSGNRTGLKPSVTSQYVVWQGVNLANHWAEVRGSGAYTNWTFKNFATWPGNIGILFDAPQANFLLDGVTFNACLPGWLAWTDVKGGETPATNARIGCISFGGHGPYVHDVEIRNCTFVEAFDAILPLAAEYNLNIHHNTSRVWDDFVQLGSLTHDIQIYNNLLTGAGPSHDGSGPSTAPGTKWVHHNIIDGTKPILWGRYDTHVPPLNGNQIGWFGTNLFATHGGGNVGNDPWKVYANTLIGGLVPAGETQIEDWYPNNTGVLHEVYNNVVYLTQRCYFTRSMEVSKGAEIYDGNLWYRPSGTGFDAAFLQVTDASTSPATVISYGGLRTSSPGGLAPLIGSTLWNKTLSYYAPGWDTNGVQVLPPADPQIPNYATGDYRPTAASPAATGAINITGKTGWLGTTLVPWRGAVPPVTDGVTSGLMGYWKLDEGTGTTAADSSGRGHAGTLISSPTWRTGELGKALTFNGTLPHVEAADNADFDFGSTGNFSVATWFQATPGCDGTILVKGSTGTLQKRYYMYVRQINGIGQLQFNMCDGTSSHTITTSTAVDDGFWHQATATVDRAGLFKLYIDGVLVNQSSATGMGDLDATMFPVAIGQTFDGSLDDVRIYNRVLTQTEVQSLYDMGSHVGSQH